MQSIIDFFDLQWIIDSWNDNVQFEYWQMFLIGMFFLLCNFGIFAAMCYCRVGIVKEYGYPNKKHKNKKRISMPKAKLLDYIFLIRITKHAPNRGFMLYLNFICHYINLFSFLLSVFGFVACMVTLADGWALILLIVSVIGAFALTALIEFIPQIIWVPSIRKRYSSKRT